MSILRRTPWSRIREQNSVHQELEIVGNGKPTGSVLRETVVVSVSISISVARGMGSPWQVSNRRRQIREGPESACAIPFTPGVAHVGEEG